MNIPTKLLKSGFSMPIYGLGTWGMGGKREKSTATDQEDISAIKTAINLGITHIDTAESYGAGHAEELVGQAIKNYDRSKLFLVSKVYGDNFKYDDVINSCKSSLKRLGTDYLDLYLLHWFNDEIPLSETMKAMDKLKEDGLIKNIGVSNFTVEHMMEAQSLTKNKIVATQVHYNLKFREPEKAGVLKYCQDNDVMLIAWRPIEKGKLDAPILLEIAKKYGKTPYQVAINWLISQNNVVTLSKTTNIDHLKENLEAITWQMNSEDIEKLRKEYPDQEDISDSVPLG